MDGARLEQPGAARRQPNQVGRAPLVDAEEGIEHRGHQDRAALVRGQRRLVGGGIGRPRLPGAGRLIDGADGVAQGASQPEGPSELAGQLAEQALLGPQRPAGRGNLVLEDLGEREVLEQRDDVGKRLVEGADVGVGRREIAAVHAVEQRVRRLVRDDVVREAGEHHAARNVLGCFGLGGAEVAEQQRNLVRRVVGVRLAQRVRIDAEAADEHRIVLAAPARRRRTVPPQAAAAERAFEVVDGQAGHGVDHLLVELRRAFTRRQPVLRQQAGIVEVHRLVEAAAGRVDVDHLQVLTDRAGRKGLPRHLEGELADHRRRELDREAGIAAVSAQAAERGLAGGEGHRRGERWRRHPACGTGGCLPAERPGPGTALRLCCHSACLWLDAPARPAREPETDTAGEP